MLWNKLPRQTVRPVALAAGRISSEHLFAGAIGVVIVAALALTIAFTFGGGRKELDPDAGLWHYKCEQCGEEFTKPPTPVSRERMIGGDMKMDPVSIDPRVDCPKCNAKQAALKMTQCPNCKKWYVDPRINDPSAKRVCPHCNMSFNQWMAEQRKKYTSGK